MDMLQSSYSEPSMKCKPLTLPLDGIHRAPARALAGLLMALSLGGCAVGPDFKSAVPPKNRDYVREPVTTNSGETEQRVVTGTNLQADWWRMLKSPELDRVVEQALANNWSLEAARANLTKAEEGIAAARGGLFPQLDAVAGAGRTKYGASFLGPEAFTFPVFSAWPYSRFCF